MPRALRPLACVLTPAAADTLALLARHAQRAIGSALGDDARGAPAAAPPAVDSDDDDDESENARGSPGACTSGGAARRNGQRQSQESARAVQRTHRGHEEVLRGEKASSCALG